MGKSDSVVVLDFETTGVSPNMGDRAIEIGAVMLEDGVVVDRFQELMNPGFYISPFIEEYTGITNEMLADAPPCDEVMRRFHDFIGERDLVAHNASFDQRFLDAELMRISRPRRGSFACSMLLARRLLQDAPNHKLGTLARYLNVTEEGDFHRALFDSEVTAKIWMKMLEDIGDRHGLWSPEFDLICRLCKTPKRGIEAFLIKQALAINRL
ncbi:3'-5' exonuclease [Pelagicoccus albus]|uniref:3'-5' exonuclease n=1 Tax=Pelagicoccus albus TaxID=415222 RepID=A0A7X1B4T5_9BACT|nr:3'-5' exonuclease [Pelagicoccus albus]MBC2604543.1 3'-5' exonuclease [Pelagicoccus albus]